MTVLITTSTLQSITERGLTPTIKTVFRMYDPDTKPEAKLTGNGLVVLLSVESPIHKVMMSALIKNLRDIEIEFGDRASKTVIQLPYDIDKYFSTSYLFDQLSDARLKATYVIIKE